MNLINSSVAILFCAVLCSCSHLTETIYEDSKVKVINKSTVIYFMVHAGRDEDWLVASGKTYKKVRGQAPFYLDLPTRSSILFVTGRTYDNGRATVHVLNYKTGGTMKFTANDSGIGDNILSASRMTDEQFEKVESLEGDKLVIVAGFLNRRFRYFIDLGKSEFEKEEAQYPIRISGSTSTNCYVIPHGISAKSYLRPVFDLETPSYK
jgi:hypothetical protein